MDFRDKEEEIRHMLFRAADRMLSVGGPMKMKGFVEQPRRILLARAQDTAASVDRIHYKLHAKPKKFLATTKKVVSSLTQRTLIVREEIRRHVKVAEAAGR